MKLTFYLKRSSPNADNKNDGYLFVELKEYSEDDYEKKKIEGEEKDQRFIVLKGISCGKFRLLDPKMCNPNDLQRIEFVERHRKLEVQQTEDKKYTFTIKILSKESDSIVDEVPGEKSNMIISGIELNPEDIVILRMFVKTCIGELLNL